MNINGTGTAYPAWREIGKTQKNGAGTGFAGKITDALGNAAATEEMTKCSHPADGLEKKLWYMISYDQDGIRCNEAYKEDGEWVNQHSWSIPFTKPGQYEKVGAFLQRFPVDTNLRFAADENFWQDFLAGKIDENAFAESFETSTNAGADEEESRIITKPDGSIVLQIKTSFCVTEIEIAKAQKSGLYVTVDESQVVDNHIAE